MNMEGWAVLIAVVLICSTAVAADPQECGPTNATTVMRVPGEFETPSICFMRGQAYLASSSIGRTLDADELVKVLCVRSETPAASADH
jgi:hypothetical protein